ncbi:MAG: hypothetical protein ACTHK0_14830 [Ginsengibacter sp.]
MKKLLLFILTLAYLASSSGATVYIQQCMGKTIAWSLIEKNGNKCEKCGMHNNANDCCSSHMKVLKVHNDQNLPEVFFQKLFLTNAFLPETFSSNEPDKFLKTETKHPESFTPFRGKTNFCILYCTFLI